MRLLAYVIIILLISISLLLAYWTFQEPKIMGDNIVTRANITVLAPGQPLVVEREYCLLENKYIGEIYRTVEDGIVYNYPILPASQELGCRKRNVLIELPPYLPDGEYVYKSRVVYEINPLKRKSYILEPVKFRIERK